MHDSGNLTCDDNLSSGSSSNTNLINIVYLILTKN
nr:MAG TPA: hypothetical protein [Caudoviricetes sp.]